LGKSGNPAAIDMAAFCVSCNWDDIQICIISCWAPNAEKEFIRMTIRSEWAAIAARIDGFLSSTAIYFQSLVASKEDSYGGAKVVLLPESVRIYAALNQFSKRHSSTLPQPAQEALHRFIDEHKEHFKEGSNTGINGIKRVAPALGSIRSEVTFHLADFGVTAKRLSERAFIHLQRSIVVDENVREKWKDAFNKGEVRCEQLGAVHLLSHGIWAFKVDAAGERTDLVFTDNGIKESAIETAAEALVLTEWKKVSSPDVRDAKASEARRQADRYSAGSLAGIELAEYRYIVLLSEKHLEPVEDFKNGDITYRHINIVVDPLAPSKS
jgi:hypothetical protein